MNEHDETNLRLRGRGRMVAAEVYFGHLADVCRGIDLSGNVTITVRSDGRVFVNGLYIPSRPKRGGQSTGVR